LLLSANLQIIEEVEEHLFLRQCIVNALVDEQERKIFTEFSKNLVKALPDLQGYIGVDIIITADEILLVEINPRLTTSYVGLKAALGINPAALILDVFAHQKLPELILTTDKSVVVDIEEERAA